MKEHIGINNGFTKQVLFIVFLIYKNNPFHLRGKIYASILLSPTVIRIKIINIRSQFHVIVSAITNHQQIFELISGGFFMPPFNSTFLKFSENTNFDPICNKNINFKLGLKYKEQAIVNCKITDFLNSQKQIEKTSKNRNSIMSI